MADRASFAYAQSRLQAHHGRRPTKATWQYLNSSKSLGHYLDSARQTGLKRWVSQLSATTDAHGIEEALRRDWRAYVGAISKWFPDPWRPALQWTGGLVDLPLTVHLARGQAVPDWAGGERQVSVLAQKSDRDWGTEKTPMAVWLDHFRTVLPVTDDRVEMESLIGVLRRDHSAQTAD